MTTGPYHDSGGYRRDQQNSVAVYLIDPSTGDPYAAGGGAGSSTVVAQSQFKEGGSWVDAPGTAARGLLVDPISGTTDGAVGLPGRIGIVGGYDGTNSRALKTSAAGVLQVDVLSGGGGGVQYTEGDTDASITGTPILWEDASDTLRAVSAAKPLPVSGPLTDTQLRATPVPVSGTVTANGPLTDAQLRASAVPVSLSASDLTALETITIGTALPAGTNNIGDVDVLTLPANASVNLNQIAGTGTAVNAGNASAGTQRVVLASDQAAVTVRGDVAHDTADSGNPQKVGARARSTDVTAVASDDRVDNIASILGKQIMLPYALPANYTKGTANSTGTSDTSVIAAPGAGISLYITCIVITNAHATVSTKVQIKSGTTSTGYPRVYAVAAGGGAVLTFPSPLKLAANEALQFACVTTGADVDVSAVGYTAAE